MPKTDKETGNVFENFAKLTKSLTQCLKNDSKIEHNPQFIKSFEMCKKIKTNDPHLKLLEHILSTGCTRAILQLSGTLPLL